MTKKNTWIIILIIILIVGGIFILNYTSHKRRNKGSSIKKGGQQIERVIKIDKDKKIEGNITKDKIEALLDKIEGSNK